VRRFVSVPSSTMLAIDHVILPVADLALDAAELEGR
jgi:hypothetical protein